MIIVKDCIGVCCYEGRLIILVLYESTGLHLMRVQPFYRSTGQNSGVKGVYLPCWKIETEGVCRIIKAAFDPCLKEDKLTLRKSGGNCYIFEELKEISDLLTEKFGNKVLRHEVGRFSPTEINKLYDTKRQELIRRNNLEK